MTLTITHTWKCDVCGEEEEHHVQREVAMHNSVSMYDLPRGWHYIYEQLVCPKHNIVVDPMIPEKVDEQTQS